MIADNSPTKQNHGVIKLNFYVYVQFYYGPHGFCYVNQVVLMLSSWHLNKKIR